MMCYNVIYHELLWTNVQCCTHYWINFRTFNFGVLSLGIIITLIIIELIGRKITMAIEFIGTGISIGLLLICVPEWVIYSNSVWCRQSELYIVTTSTDCMSTIRVSYIVSIIVVMATQCHSDDYYLSIIIIIYFHVFYSELG